MENIIPKEYEVKFEKKKEIYPSTKLFVFGFEKKFDFVPGQFIMFEIKDDQGNNVRRSYSLASLPGKKTINLVS